MNAEKRKQRFVEWLEGNEWDAFRIAEAVLALDNDVIPSMKRPNDLEKQAPEITSVFELDDPFLLLELQWGCRPCHEDFVLDYRNFYSSELGGMEASAFLRSFFEKTGRSYDCYIG